LVSESHHVESVDLGKIDAGELSARIKTLLRRPSSLLSTQLSARGAVLEVENKTLIAGANRIVLRARECALLEFLMRNQNRTFSAKALLDSVWPNGVPKKRSSKTEVLLEHAVG
jgi:Response regulators consisting of a CheY-like receiver domain and a winged-helix DNA-binding domain